MANVQQKYSKRNIAYGIFCRKLENGEFNWAQRLGNSIFRRNFLKLYEGKWKELPTFSGTDYLKLENRELRNMLKVADKQIGDNTTKLEMKGDESFQLGKRVENLLEENRRLGKRVVELERLIDQLQQTLLLAERDVEKLRAKVETPDNTDYPSHH